MWAWPRWASRIAVVPPTLPAPTTVTFLRAATSVLPALEPPHDLVGDLRGADRGRVVRARLHVVRDVFALGDDVGQGALQPIAGLGLVHVAQHHRPAEHHRHR